MGEKPLGVVPESEMNDVRIFETGEEKKMLDFFIWRGIVIWK